MTESEPGPESLPEYRILDQDNISDPETLLLVINDILERQRALETALALSIALTLLHLGEIAPPENGLETTITSLRGFLEMASDASIHRAFADQMRDLLEAQE
jgi:hypothetical protein